MVKESCFIVAFMIGSYQCEIWRVFFGKWICNFRIVVTRKSSSNLEIGDGELDV